MKTITLSFQTEFDENIEYKTNDNLYQLFNDFYLSSLSSTLTNKLTIDSRLYEETISTEYGVDTLLSFIKNISQETKNTLIVEKIKDNFYSISFSFQFEDNPPQEAMKYPTIENFIDKQLISFMIEQNVLFKDLVEKESKAWLICEAFHYILLAMQKTRIINVSS